MCWRISRDTAVKYLEYASLSAAASGVLIALVGLTLVSWTSIIPKADQCIETWPSTNITTQCTFERKMYSEDIPELDKAATGVVKFMQAAVAAVGFCVAVMFLPPLFAACAKKRGTCMEKNAVALSHASAHLLDSVALWLALSFHLAQNCRWMRRYVGLCYRK